MKKIMVKTKDSKKENTKKRVTSNSTEKTFVIKSSKGIYLTKTKKDELVSELLAAAK